MIRLQQCSVEFYMAWAQEALVDKLVPMCYFWLLLCGFLQSKLSYISGDNVSILLSLYTVITCSLESVAYVDSARSDPPNTDLPFLTNVGPCLPRIPFA